MYRKVLVLGVIYKGIEKYLNDYFDSLNGRVFTDFDILIIEDGIELPKNFCHKKIATKKSEPNSTPAMNRALGIEYAKKEGFDIIIFTDCDDYFSSNRIESNCNKLVFADFCVNCLIPVDEKKI